MLYHSSGVVVHASNLTTQAAEVGRSLWVQGKGKKRKGKKMEPVYEIKL